MARTEENKGEVEQLIPIFSLSSCNNNGNNYCRSKLSYGTSSTLVTSSSGDCEESVTSSTSTTSSSFEKENEGLNQQQLQQQQSQQTLPPTLVTQRKATDCSVSTMYNENSSSLSPSSSEASNLMILGGDFCQCEQEQHSGKKESFGSFKNDTSSVMSNNVLYNNRKLFLSVILWFTTYELMGVVGGTIAFLHFPRTPDEQPIALPDYGYDIIPYFCPYIPYIPHGNLQSFVLMIFYVILLIGVFSTMKKAADEGRLILQQLLHLNVLVFITRTTTVCVTGLPQPNPRCVDVQHDEVNYAQALDFVMLRSFLPHACGDLVYSGHVGCTLVCFVIMWRHNYLVETWKKVAIISLTITGILSTLSCRSHYTVDVVLAFYFIRFLSEFYFLRSEHVVDGGYVGQFIRWLERPDYSIDDDKSINGYDQEKEENVMTTK